MYIDSPNISGSLTISGSLILNGTPVTASGGSGTGAGFPFSGSAVITGSLYVSGGSLSGSFVGDGAGLTGITINQFATYEDTFTNAPSHSAVHNFGTKNVFVQVFESDDTLLIPYSVTTTTANQVDIVFGDTLSGRVVIGRAGHILQDTGNFVSSSTAVQTFTNATTASINHYLDSFNVITQVFDSNNNVIVPSNIKVATKDRVDLTFASSRSGKVVIAKAGHIVSGSIAIATSASFATTAVSASYAETSSIAERVQAGTSGSRDLTTPQTGSLWYNTNTDKLQVYNGSLGSGWSDVSQATSGPYDIDYLVVAGGGAGSGGTRGAAGGAGGLRTSYGSTSGGGASSEDPLNVIPGTSYDITVGAGGNTTGTWNNTGIANKGTNGANSSFSSIESLGGGAGGNNDGAPGNLGLDGGSGGGSWYVGTNGGAGTSGQGYAGGVGSTQPNYIGGGGGGAAAVGQNGGTSSGGNGGNGLEVNIIGGTGNYYAGGGSADKWGGISGSPIPGTPGLGGGGTGNNNDPMNQSGTAGTVNTGGGGGSGGTGGSGVVILRMPTSRYSGTTTGSPTVTTDGTDTILTYTQSGTYTA